ncbi:sensor histidine kinase [Edaphobacillus lindanitolerans]|uniref:histidine kinase n=1 Tax=Edaphobacillus lindanitolerans TaxID=550447 RepID=A0A1U7PT11_9BACI|nr:HAMP domain-containing sensor histidine kinase [Edaphobacillus lindanitolerans]SIT91111.1 Signal transduction histidine kinase [Edaphobacillus lindanitolerans]
MHRKLSVRLGILLFGLLLLIELVLYAVLYVTLVDERSEEVIGQLLARGNTHRNALEDVYDDSTLSHVAMMESASRFTVVITDETGGVIRQSDPLDTDLQEWLKQSERAEGPHGGRILESAWRNHDYIVTDSPIVLDGNHAGHVLMFAPSGMIRQMVAELGRRFMTVGGLSVLITLVVIPVLTRFITRPLLQMKQATEQLATGGSLSGLDDARTDELGDLARSIGQLSADLDRLKAERNDFLASVAHELRTPITYIKGYADLAARPDTPEERRKEYSAIIRREAGHLSVLVGQLLDLARLDRPDFAIRTSSVRLSELAGSVIDLVGPAFTEKGVRLICKVPDNLSAELDAARFQQVLLNLLDNALHHTPSGKAITLSAESWKQGIRIRVDDEGEGIPTEELTAVFERFFRVDKSRSRKSGGTGLGLAIAKEIVEAHGGTIRAESSPGKGASMIITLERGRRRGMHPARRR